MKFAKSFNKEPYVEVKEKENECLVGWESISRELKKFSVKTSSTSRIVIVETYQGVFLDALKEQIKNYIQPDILLDTSDAFKEEESIREMTYPDVTDDRVFGYMTRLNMIDFLDKDKLAQMQKKVADVEDSTVVIFGFGASLVWDEPDVMIYADMARWEIQRRMRQNLVNNLGIVNRTESAELKYKRGFFVDWRVCDRLKKKTVHQWDYVLDTNDENRPKLVSSDAIMEGIHKAAHQPFSVVPFFDPGPWGGQWMKDNFDLNREEQNYAWCFNCVPEENSLLLKFGETKVEIPAINVVFFQTVNLLGPAVYGRFGDEFPIRFDFLDTMDGGNLSLQVHPLTEYIQEKFGMHYTQDESYYLMDADADGSVYLGLKEGVDREKMETELRIAEKEGVPFDPSLYVENWPAKKHDHFLIPAGSIHCSGKNSMVLEISATPYIFTFKLYDWGRKNLDGKPRPINVDHGLNNIQWDRTTEWTRQNLLPKVEKITEGEDWTEEKTGLHEREFIETRRHWFTGKVTHNTGNGVNVITLVEGEEIVVESPENRFEPIHIHYAETFIVPAAVGEYTIRPYGSSEGKKCATVKAFVRSNA